MRWQWAAGPFVGILVAGYLEGFMQAPLAWAIGGLIWGVCSSFTMVTIESVGPRIAITLYHGSMLGFMNWLLDAYI